MEMEGRDDGHGRWSYRRKQTGSSSSSYTISSSAGTIVSTIYTSSASLPSSLSAAAAVAKLLDLEFDEDTPWIETEKRDAEFLRPIKKSRLQTQKEMATEKEKVKEIKFLVQEFFGAPSSSSDCSTKGGDTSILDWWLKHLGVGWLLLQGAAGAGASAAAAAGTPGTCFDAQSWIQALAEITETIRVVASLCHGGKNHQQPDTGIEASTTADEFQTQFAQFIQQAMLKMLTFVDFTAIAPKDKTTLLEDKYHKLSTLLCVRGALSRTLAKIMLAFHSPSSVQVGRIQDEIVNLLSTKESEAAEAIWSTMEVIRMVLIEDGGDDLLTSLTPQGLPDIHKSTRSVVDYVKFLWVNSSSLSYIVYEAASLGKYVPRFDPVHALNSMMVEMVSWLQEKLANMSESFSEPSLRFLFLINNLNFIYDTLESDLNHLKAPGQDLTRQVLIHMESYLRVSWEPVLSCLLSSTPQCFGRNHSPLSKFLSEFQKIYNTQKHWKIPNPTVRRMLRDAITNKIIPSYKEHIEENKVTTPELSPLEIEQMLQELFEG